MTQEQLDALDLHNLKGILRYAEESLVDLELN